MLANYFILVWNILKLIYEGHKIFPHIIMKILQTLQFFKLGLVWRLGGDIENTGIENIDIENNDLDILTTPTQPQINHNSTHP